jgi:hypothetical protein
MRQQTLSEIGSERHSVGESFEFGRNLVRMAVAKEEGNYPGSLATLQAGSVNGVNSSILVKLTLVQ